jgi:hypothetical protein
MGRSSKAKGSAYERRVVDNHKEAGIEAQRVPLSGAMAGYKDDITIGPNAEYRGEVKARKLAQGWKVLKQWKGDAPFLFLQEIAAVGKGKSPKPLVVMDFDLYAELMKDHLEKKLNNE